MNSQKFSLYILDFDWNYLFVNAFACLNLKIQPLDLIGRICGIHKPETEIVDTAALNSENERLEDSIDNVKRLNAQPVQNPNDIPYTNSEAGNSRGKGKGHKNR